MTNPGAYPPTQAGQGNQGIVIAAAPGEPLAEAIAAELRRLGWNAAVAERVETYAGMARAYVAPLTPASINSPAVAAALAARGAPLIPLTVGATPLPSGPWAIQPVIFSGDPAQTARDLTTVINNLTGGNATIPFGQQPASRPLGASDYMAPTTPPTFPPSQFAPTMEMASPAQPYQSAPSYPTQQGYTQYPQGGAPYAPYGAPPAPAKRRRWPLIVGVIVAVVLLACVGGGAFAYSKLHSFVGAVSTGVSQTETASAATATPAATAAPSIPANFTVYSDSTAKFSIAYPNSWQKSASGGDVIFLDTAEAADVVVGSVDANIPQSDINSTESQFFKSAAGAGTYNNLQGPTTVTYAGESWTQESADITSSGQTLHAVVLVANHGSHAYVIGYLGAKSAFATLDAQDFQPMLNSLSFLS